MTLLWKSLRGFIAALVVLFGAGAATAQQADAPWQGAIAGQIEAFRAHDPAGAFGYASAPFHARFASAEAFFVAIAGSGYAPIVESRSHSFGEFEVLGDDSVLQKVQLIGSDQSLYAAIYQVGEEADGWRVMGVQLTKQPGMGI